MKHPSQNLLRRELVRVLQLVAAKGWVANHDGNISMRLSGNRFLASPTAFSKAAVREQDLLILNPRNQVLQGSHRPFSEIALHHRAFKLRPDAQVVLHAHPPNTTGMAVAGREIDPCIIAEAVVSLGDRLPLAPYALPGTEESVDVLDSLFPFYDVVVLENHGVLAIGDSPEQAFLRMELCEHLATITLAAERAGGARRIPQSDIDRLLFKRTKAGLGPEARGLELPTTETQLVGPCSGPIN